MTSSNEKKFLSPKDKEKLLETMEDHFQTFLRARSLTPYLHKPEAVELASNQPGDSFLISTAPLYQNFGYSCQITFETTQFDTEEKYKQYQDIGIWINQSFFIELKCIIDSFVVNWSSCPLRDKEYYLLLEKCRHLFAHSSYKLKYRPARGHKHDYEHALELYNRLFDHKGKTDTKIDLSIDTFIIPFYRKLVELIDQYL